MTYSTKAYTLNSLIDEVSNINGTAGANPTALVDTLSPRAGVRSVKLQVINEFLNGRLSDVLSGTSTTVTGATPRTRLLRALRARKKYGSFYN